MNLKKYFFTVLFIFTLSHISFSQNISVNWFEYSNNKANATVTDMILSENNILITGIYEEKIPNKNDTTIIKTIQNIFIAKYSEQGKLIWEKQINGENYKYISDITTDTKGNFIVTGFFKKSLVIENKTLIAQNYIDNFIIKYSPSGEIINIIQPEGKFNTHKTFVITDLHNNLYYAGSFCEKLNINNFNANAGYQSDIFIIKYSPEGEFINAINLNGNKEDILNDIKIDNNSNIIITGSFEDDLTLSNTILYSKGRTDIFVAKLDKNLRPIFALSKGSYYEDYGQALSIDNQNNIYLSGNFSDKILFAKDTLTSNGVLDVFICKYNETGRLLWADSFGGNANDYLKSLTSNNENDIYLSGHFRGSISKNNIEINSYNFTNDFFIAKYQNNGKFKYINKIGGSKQDIQNELFVDNKNLIYLSGNFQKNCVFANDSISTTQNNHFVVSQLFDCDFAPKLNLPNDTIILTTEFTISANPNFANYKWVNNTSDSKQVISNSNKITTNISGTYFLTVTDSMACQSSDSINIIFEEPFYEKNILSETDDLQQKQLKATVFPNPTETDFNLTVNNINTKENLLIEIYSNNGQIIYLQKTETPLYYMQQKIETLNNRKGTFFIRITNGNQSITKEIISF